LPTSSSTRASSRAVSTAPDACCWRCARRSSFYRSIGKKGGETTQQRHGPQFYEKIGRKGGQTMRKLIERAERMRRGS
jgi:general stress protein YciG